MGKILVIAAAIVMIAAGTGIAYTAIEHEKEKENGTEDGLFGSSGTDYSLLDPSNIVAGLTVTYTGTPYYGEYEERILVTSVNGDDVDFSDTIYTKHNDYSPHKYGMDMFKPNLFDFDYTDENEIPNTVTVSIDGNKYTLNGSYTDSNIAYNYTFTYTSLEITLVGGEVTGVSGITNKVHENADQRIEQEYDYKTENTNLLSRSTLHIYTEEETSIDSFYGGWIDRYEANDYTGATITSTSGTYDGLDVTVYTVNGTVTDDDDEYNYSDYKVYVYNGYVLECVGKINGNDQDIRMSIFVS